VGVEDDGILRHMEMINYNIMRIPFTYLGMPIGANPRRFQTQILVVEREGID